MDVARDYLSDIDESQPDAPEQKRPDRPYLRAAHELTARELDEQRRLVRASLLMTAT